ncbi:two-component system chemotaxis response regulator CheB [Breznakibacter xylanolyticus]|uniref:protein-glutamate methylesterase n=1 Tax=Breznakibacter xylanolyticus TaxID=990 RepID=A0A2W7N8I2_9BACT|nr:chemotaxis protein CheB [Breznakibacter xylanolyticus]MBN2744613.1 chemotaxis protein CheB [Marinilabiliaceae bacterium]PZX16715.1 two-component system chemotaxis response regulator CheB [Breznakibacter xylanolyticus]
MTNNNYKAIVIGGSAGSFSVVSKILSKLNPDFQIPIILCLHRLKYIRSGLVEGLNLKSKINVIEPLDKEKIKSNTAYLAPSNYHLFIEFDNTFSLSTEESYNHSRPSIDYTLSSAAHTFREKCVGILLTGANKDGAKGIKDIFDKKGYTIVQDPETCDIKTMPQAALRLFQPHKIMSPDEISAFLNSL